MQIVKVMGGLGNQMFSYAFALALRARGREVKLDVTWYDRNRAHNGWELGSIFPLDIGTCSIEERDELGDFDSGLPSRLRRKLLGERRGHYRERRPGYDARFLEISGGAYLEGFWQSPRYHEGIEDEIEAAFAFPLPMDARGEELLRSAAGRCVVGVHVRRGDYLQSEALSEICTEAYYRRALAAVLEDAEDPLVLFFSDDIDWCKRRLSGGLDAVFVDWNRGRDAWRDMRLMGRCDRLVIANSSFSWWGARLGSPGRKVFAPRRWFGGDLADNPGIAMPDWRRIED